MPRVEQNRKRLSRLFFYPALLSLFMPPTASALAELREYERIDRGPLWSRFGIFSHTGRLSEAELWELPKMKSVATWTWPKDMVNVRWRNCLATEGHVIDPNMTGVTLQGDGGYALIPTIAVTNASGIDLRVETFPITVWDCRKGKAVGEMVSTDAWQVIRDLSLEPNGKGVVAILGKWDSVSRSAGSSCCRYWGMPMAGVGETVTEGEREIKRAIISHDAGLIASYGWSDGIIHVFGRGYVANKVGTDGVAPTSSVKTPESEDRQTAPADMPHSR